MAEIRVTSRELRNKADTLENLNRNFRKEVEKLDGYEKQLATMYEGESQKAFHKAFNDDKLKMDRFALNVDKYVVALREAAQRYEEAENKATQIATERNS